MKTHLLKCFVQVVIVSVSLLCFVKGKSSLSKKFVECCLSCIGSPSCHSFLYTHENRTCMRQRDMLAQALSVGNKNITLVQLQKIGTKMLQFRATVTKISISNRSSGNIQHHFQISESMSSLKKPSCPQEKVKIFHEACRKGKLVRVKRMLASAITYIECRDLTRDNFGRTPLLTAVSGGSIPVVDLLKKRGADLFAVDKDKDNILHTACEDGNVDMVKHVMQLNIIDIESRGNYGRTPVMTAVCEGHIKVVKLLKERGANLQAVDHNNDTILHTACFCSHIKMIKYILSLKVIGIESRGQFLKTPLLDAVFEREINVVKFLKKRGANLKAVDEDNNNILHTACMSGKVNMVKYVISLHIKGLRNRGNHGRTPVMTAVFHGYVPIVKLLKKRGAHLKVVDKDKMNILHMACLFGHGQMVKYVLSLDIVDLESRDRLGRTPVMTAVCEGHIKVVKLLKERGANLNVVDKDNNNILHTACMNGTIDMVKYVTSLHIIDIESRDRLGRTPLMVAVIKGYMETVKLLYQRYGAKVTVVDYHRSNVLHLACEYGKLEIVMYLITLQELYGFERRRNKFLYTPVDVAGQEGHSNIVRILEERVTPDSI